MKSVRLVVLSGLPGSGKSTYARRLSAASNLYIISRDDLRRFFPSVDEFDLTQRLAELASSFLRNWVSVVVDSPNLDPQDEIVWTDVAKRNGAILQWVHLNTSVDECVRRNACRPSALRTKDIRALALKYQETLNKLELEFCA